MSDFFQDYSSLQTPQQVDSDSTGVPTSTGVVPSSAKIAASTPKSNIHQDIATLQQNPDQPLAQTTSGLNAAFDGFNQGIQKFVGPISDWADRKILTNMAGWSNQDVTNAMKDRDTRSQAEQSQHPLAYGAGNVAGTLAGAAPSFMTGNALIPGAAAGAGAVSSLARTGAQAAVGSALMGASETPTDGSSRAGNAIRSGLIGGVLGGAGGAIAGTFTGMAPEAAEGVQAATQLGIKPSLADASANPLINTLTNKIMTNLPSGIVSLRNSQNGDIQSAVKSMASAMAGDVGQNKEDIAKAIQDQYAQAKSTSDGLYQDVSDSVKDSDAGPVDLTNFKKNLDNLPMNPSNTLSSAVDSLKQIPDQLPFGDVQDVRSNLMNLEQQIGKQTNTGVSSHNDYQFTKDLVDHMSNAMDNWGTVGNNMDVLQKYAIAKGNYASMQSVFRDPNEINNIVNDHGNIYSTVKRLLTNDNPEYQQNLVNALGDNAPAARAYQLNNALQSSLNTKNGQSLLDLDKFTKTLNKPGDASQKVVWGSEYQKLQGLNKAIKLMAPGQNAAQGAAMGGVGKLGEVGGMAAAAAMGHPGAALGAVTLGGMARVMNDPAVLPLLMRAGGMTEAATPGARASLQDAVNSAAPRIQKALGPMYPVQVAAAQSGVNPNSTIPGQT